MIGSIIRQAPQLQLCFAWLRRHQQVLIWPGATVVDTLRRTSMSTATAGFHALNL
jgi:hypothetical protein